MLLIFAVSFGCASQIKIAQLEGVVVALEAAAAANQLHLQLFLRRAAKPAVSIQWCRLWHKNSLLAQRMLQHLVTGGLLTPQRAEHYKMIQNVTTFLMELGDQNPNRWCS